MVSTVLSGRRRVEVRVEGVVQGVGFRPFVHRLASEHRLAGFVLNDERGVLLEAEGEPAEVERFIARLEADAPPLARVEQTVARELAPHGGGEGFEIAGSEGGGEPQALVSADAATCAECLSEVFDEGDRRHRYPFTNCTNCGPRFTIVRDVPYDRPLTTMADFEMCAPCRAEYDDPEDRRFHAQPNACPACGPALSLLDAEGADWAGGDGDAVARTVAALASGRIVAIKGIGGYHLACLAADAEAVGRLRTRKHREEKPFAVMAPSLEWARRLVALTPVEEGLLCGAEAPILIARRLPDAAVAPGVAPSGPDLGVMLPYSPLHHLLCADAGEPLVMTSANVSDEPIAHDDADARSRLAGIADLFLVHDRPIHTRTDDSVVRSLDPGLRSEPLLIRRSRGFVPAAISLPAPVPRPILACGAELKATFCIAKGRRAWVSHHIGDLKNYETLSSYRAGIANFERLFAVEPELVAHDLHPDYLSSSYALSREGVEHVAIQHHHAHLAAVLAEHRVPEAVGAIYDGTGLGPDDTVWGGELLVGGASGYQRAGLLFPVRLPGGDAAARQPWRMACSWLVAACEEESPPIPAALASVVGEPRWQAICELIRGGVASPLTTSAGRLFDGVAALCGVRAEVNYEGQAAVELEGLASPQPGRGYPMPLIADGEAPILIDPRETIRAIIADLEAGTGLPVISGRFHEALASATAAACATLAEDRGLDTVALSGGVFQNRLLLERTAELLTAAGLRPLLPRLLPPNDGAISFGQVAIAAVRARA